MNFIKYKFDKWTVNVEKNNMLNMNDGFGYIVTN